MGGLTSAAAAQMGAATALSDNKETSTKEEHWVEFEFVDKAGKPVSGVHYKFTDPGNKESEGVLRPDGRIRRDALKAGQCQVQLFTVSNAKWSKNRAGVGEKVKLTADVEGFDNGKPATIQIYKRDIKGPDVVFETIETVVKSSKVEAEWEYIVSEDEDDESPGGEEKGIYSAPEYYFEVIIGRAKGRSGLLEYKDWIEIELKDIEDRPIANADYIVILESGEVRKGQLDSHGHKKIEKVPPVKWKVEYPEYPLSFYSPE
jgi:hypothetical protein